MKFKIIIIMHVYIILFTINIFRYFHSNILMRARPEKYIEENNT